MIASFVLPVVAAVVSVATISLMLSSMLGRHLLDRPNERSLHARPTPRGGGLGIIAGVAATWWSLGSLAVPGLLAIGLAALSVVDDWRGLPQSWRFAGHGLAAVIATAHGLHGLPWPWLAIVAFAVVWMTNLFNFMDGSNGLAGGMALFGFGSYAIAAWLAGQGELANGSACVAAAAAGFLAFNFDPARIFMGDVGSIPLGFLAAALGAMGWHAGAWPWWFPILVFLPFAADATVTLLRRMFRGERFWEAHRSHYYQRLILMGWSHRRTALVEYASMAGVGAVALCLRTAPWPLQAGGLVTVLVAFAALAALVDRRWRQFGVTSPARAQP